jgi:hypothetical protein
MKRELSSNEKLLLVRMAEFLPDNAVRQQLLADIETADILSESAVQGACSLIFRIAGYSRPSYEGQRTYPVEGRIADKDGAQMHVFLYCDQNSRLYELEMLRLDEREILQPDLNTLDLY